MTGHSRVVRLCAGGVLRVALEGVTLGDFGEDERALFSAIADAIYSYEQKQTKQPEALEPTPATTED